MVQSPPMVTVRDEALAAGVGRGGGAVDPLSFPAKIGRFAVLGPLGSGGMGVVLAAYDEALDRRIALKVLHRASSGGHDRRHSLRREAKALARLSHPNVVQVFEVGEHQSQVYVAMELVEGETLTQWVKAKPRNFEEILRVLCGAGRGLAAAHERGLVHRDFKPDNVLVGEDGRPRVLDFGLVRATAGSRTTLNTLSMGPPDTRGKVAGTVPFMAPEQLLAMPVDARTDQFAFCVSLYEAVYGRHPFEAEGAIEMGLRIIQGTMDPPPRGVAPRWLKGVLERGMARKPEDRYPDIRTLLDALEGHDVRSRPSGWLVGTAALLMGLGVASTVHTPEHNDACRSRTSLVDDVWNDERRQEIQQAFERSGVRYSEATWERVRSSIDDYAAKWNQSDREACEVSVVVPESAALVGAWQQCLDGHLHELRSLVDVLGRADDAAVERAVVAAARLPSVSGCSDASSLSEPVEPGRQAESKQLRAQFSRARAELDTGHAAVAAELLEGRLEQARAMDDGALYAEALVLVGKTQMATGHYPEAEQMLSDGFSRAQSEGLDELAVDAGVKLMHLVGDELRRFDEGLTWARHTEVAIQRGNIEGRLVAWVHNNRAGIAMRQGNYDEARRSAQKALSIEADDIGDLDTAAFELSLGNVYLSQRSLDEAKAHYTRSLELRERAVGSEHPLLLAPLVNLGNIELVANRPASARVLLERGLVLSKQPGEPSLVTADVLVNLGIALIGVNELGRAEQRISEAREILVNALGENHPRVAHVLGNLADVYSRQGRFDESEQAMRQAIELIETMAGPDHPELGIFREDLQALLELRAAQGEAAGGG
ncbi:MAG: tetratricopeptide repeat protein [Myxococcota bacterium]